MGFITGELSSYAGKAAEAGSQTTKQKEILFYNDTSKLLQNHRVFNFRLLSDITLYANPFCEGC